MRTLLSLSPLEHGAFVLVGLLVYAMVTRIGEQHRHPSAAVAWVMFIALVPYLAIPLFLAFGTRKLVRARPGTGSRVAAGEGGPAWALGLLAALEVEPPVRNRAIAFHADGAEARAALLALLDEARASVDLATFVLADDDTGRAVGAALVRAARRGVRARLLLDGIGGLRTSRRLVRELRQGGVTVRRFMPVLRNPVRGRTNLRNHRKLAVADGERLWSGGRNLADEYFVGPVGQAAWLDLSFVVDGPLAARAREGFERDWQGARGGSATLDAPPPRGDDPRGDAQGGDAQGGASAQLVASGPDHSDDTLHALLLAAAWHARARILAVTPYFVPDEALLSAWCIACRRGVQLTLVVPRRSNHWMADVARERALRALAAAGARIVLFPTMLHAKAVVVDDALALCGSANLDGRSLFVNFELTTAFYGQREIAWLGDWIDAQARRAAPYEARPPSPARDVLEGVVRAVGFQL